MKALNAAAIAHILQTVTSLAVCWRVEGRNKIVLGTEHSRDIPIASTGSPLELGGDYLARANITGSDFKASDDLSVDNAEVTGSYNRAISVTDLRAIDIEMGVWDNAAVYVFLVNWKAPDDFQIILGAGPLGDITRTAEGRYVTERRGLTQRLSKNFIRSDGVMCDAELFDARCKLDRVSHTYAGTVTSVTSRRVFNATITTPPADAAFTRGKVVWTSGANDTFEMEVRQVASGVVTLYLPMEVDIEVGDTFDIEEGCTKLKARCQEFSNYVNFRGHGILIPGQHEILKIGGQERASG